MDKGLDKRYMSGVEQALRAKYGQQKAEAVMTDAWRRYAELVSENADEPKRCICTQESASIRQSPPLTP